MNQAPRRDWRWQEDPNGDLSCSNAPKYWSAGVYRGFLGKWYYTTDIPTKKPKTSIEGPFDEFRIALKRVERHLDIWSCALEPGLAPEPRPWYLRLWLKIRPVVTPCAY